MRPIATAQPLGDPLAVLKRAAPDADSLRNRRGYTRDELHSVAALGYVFYLNDQLAEAQTIFEGLAAIDPSDEYPLRALGAVLCRKGEYEQALRALSEAIMVAPQRIPAYVIRGEMQLALDRVNGAVRDLQQAVKLGRQIGKRLTDEDKHYFGLAEALLSWLKALARMPNP